MAKKSTAAVTATASATAAAPMTAEQTGHLRRLAHDAYELDAFSRRLTRVEAGRRIAMLEAKLKLLDEPPHSL
jgi:hypothetical protein